MDQRGFVEINHFKNEQLYRAYLPMGVQWREVYEALCELNAEVLKHTEAMEKQAADAQAAADAQEAATPIDVAPEPVSE